MIAPVVDSSWLATHQEDVVLVDCRWYLDGRSGREAYAEGHIPGSIFVDLETRLSGEGRPEVGRHPLPSPSHFAQGMSEIGIGDGATVVAYDDAGGVIAARLVWMLRVLGENAALLDGGIQMYTGPLQRSSPVLPTAIFSAREWPANRLANIDEASDSRKVVIDARIRERYRGESDPVDPRFGHIPGAVNVPCRENLNVDGTFLPLEILRKRFEGAGVKDGEDVISYCGSGVTACHNLLTLEYAGLGQGRLFPGSWSQYSHALDRAVSTGSEPK